MKVEGINFVSDIFEDPLSGLGRGCACYVIIKSVRGVCVNLTVEL